MKETWTRRVKVALTGLAFVALFGVALQGLISTPQGLAGGTATVSVQANVRATCFFTTTSATLNFGNLYQGSAPPDVTVTASLTFKCTSNNTAYTITDDNGQYYDGTTQRMRHATVTTAFIPYTYCYTTGTAPNPCNTDTPSFNGTGGTAPITLNISATVRGTDYANAQTGSYSDTVTMTISP